MINLLSRWRSSMDSHSPTSLRMSVPSSGPAAAYTESENFNFECSVVETGRGRTKPVPRSGHRVVASHANMYSYGGYNPYSNPAETGLFFELWCYNFASRKWTLLSEEGPPEAASHSMILVGDFILVWGGTGYPWGHSLSNRLHSFHIPSRKWQTIQSSGEVPSPCYGQSLTYKDGLLYTVGGTTGNQYNVEIHKLDLKTMVYDKEVPTGPTESRPLPRYRHEVAVWEDWLFVLGGVAGDVIYDFAEIPMFHTEKKVWVTGKSQLQAPSQGYPVPRKFHAAVQFEHFAYICGGHTGTEVLFDIWRLDLRSLEWARMRQNLPIPLYFHAATVTPLGCMYVFGGVMIDISERRSNKVFKMWLTVPPLQEMVWDMLTSKYPKLFHKKPVEAGARLRSMGYALALPLQARLT